MNRTLKYLLAALCFAVMMALLNLTCQADRKADRLEAQATSPATAHGAWVQQGHRVWYCLLPTAAPDGIDVAAALADLTDAHGEIKTVSFQAYPSPGASAVLVVVTD